METHLPAIEEVRAAGELIYRFMRPTEQYCWPLRC